MMMGEHHFSKRWGAEPLGDDRWRFSLWAPDARELAVEIDGAATPMIKAPDGWFTADAVAEPGQSYMFRIDDALYPDPAARAQAGDVHGPSLLVDPSAYRWTNEWTGVPWHQAVIYELHVGTFTAQGTLEAARMELARLKALGVTLVELMPLAQFEGQRGWGYDGVLLYAPHNGYGSPDDLKHFVDTAHGLGLGVILDVVYNHFGPSGNYLAAWCPTFFHGARASAWGDGIAYEQQAVRSFFRDNSLYWLEEYQLDGLRLDAVHAMGDDSSPHILDDIAQAVRVRNWGRHVHLITEDERNLAGYFRDDAPFDATWNDDWHHAVHCLLTGEHESYYAPFAVDPLDDIETALRDGYVEQGQARLHSETPRGEPSTDLPRTAFINFLGNHDQVGNRAQGERLHHLVQDEDALRVVTALTLLTPFTPMLFMGDEFLTPAPFLFFTDFSGELADAVRTGRAKEFERFSAFTGDVPDPNAPVTVERSRIGHATTDAQLRHEAYVRDLLALRAEHVQPLLARNVRPFVTIKRESAQFEACWSFGPGRLLLNLSLGGGSVQPLLDPFFVEAREGSRFALTAAVRTD